MRCPFPPADLIPLPVTLALIPSLGFAANFHMFNFKGAPSTIPLLFVYPAVARVSLRISSRFVLLCKQENKHSQCGYLYTFRWL